MSGVSSMTSFQAASQGSGYSWRITTGPNGNLWFTESSGAGAIGEINPTTDAITQFATPTASSAPWGIAAGPDGNLWFTENSASKIGVINPTTGAITEFATPTKNAGPQDITAGPDGNLWFTEAANKIGMINPTTDVVTEFAIPTKSSGDYGIVSGPDGNLWFTEMFANKIGMINPTTHAITEFSIPNGDGPTEIASGPDGNLWFGQYNTIGNINPTTHVFMEFPVSNGPIGITAGPDGNVWFAEGYAVNPANIGMINPTTDVVTEYPELRGLRLLGIATGPDGNLWFAEATVRTASIGVATLNSSQLVVTSEPPSGVTAGSAFGLTVEAEDSSGNPITSFNGTVTVALANNPGGATLGGTLTATASNGVATFSGLTLTAAASGYTLYVSGGGFGWGFANTITVTPAAPTQVVITTEPPATVKVNTAFGLQASIEDEYGNVVTSDSNTVTVAFANNPTGATLSGTLSVAASQGVATFSGLEINKTGTGYTLQVTSSGLSSAVSSAIKVTKTGTAIVAATVPIGITAPDSLLAPLVFDSPEFLDSLGLKKRNRLV